MDSIQVQIQVQPLLETTLVTHGRRRMEMAVNFGLRRISPKSYQAREYICTSTIPEYLLVKVMHHLWM